MLSPKKNGGWWDLGVSTNASTVCEASELPPSDPAVRKRYAEYAASNFNDHFESGQGVETVFDVLAPLSPRRRWLDVAAGTSTWFWAQAVEGQTEIVLSDIRVEPLRLSERAAASGVFPPAYAGARATCGLPPGALRAALAARRTYAVFDARGSWPSALTGHDLITMIGFCGLRTADEIYTTELDGACAALAPGVASSASTGSAARSSPSGTDTEAHTSAATCSRRGRSAAACASRHTRKPPSLAILSTRRCASGA